MDTFIIKVAFSLSTDTCASNELSLFMEIKRMKFVMIDIMIVPYDMP
jgi:hypothetical protein